MVLAQIIICSVLASSISATGQGVQYYPNKFPIIAEWNSGNTAESQLIYFQSTIIVPPIPDVQWQTLAIWPGIQPLGSPNMYPVGNGVLQPVLTWGNTCAPDPTSNGNLDQWWISGQYVNTDPQVPYTCTGGDRMTVYPGDYVTMTIEYQNSTQNWIQTISDQQTGNSVSFTTNLQGQEQGQAVFVMEETATYYVNPPKWVVTDLTMRYTEASTENCQYYPAVNMTGNLYSLECAQTIQSGDTCTVSYCLFNGAQLPSTSSVSMTLSQTATITASMSVNGTGTVPIVSPTTTQSSAASKSEVSIVFCLLLAILFQIS